MRTDFQYLLVQQDGGVLTFTMNRPEVYNTFNETMLKELMNKSLESDLATSLRLEGELQDQAFQTEDHREGVAAFLQKRRPNYTGR